MSLMVCFSPDTHPVLLADTLLSSPLGRRSLVLPSIGNRHVHLPASGKYSVHGMEQKVVPLTDNVLVAWAGDYHSARTILSGLRDWLKGARASRFAVKAYLEANHLEERQRVSLIFCILEGNGVIQTEWYSCRETFVPPLGPIILAGSGAERARKYVNQVNMNLLQAGNHARIGIAAALTLAGCLLADEMVTGAPIANLFGGAYEIASFWDGKLQTLSDCTYLFWFPEQTADGGFGFNLSPRKVMRRYELNGQTAYRCIELDTEKGLSAKIVREEVFIWKRFLAQGPDLTGYRVLPSLNSPWQVSVFCARLLNGQHQIAAQVSYRNDVQTHMVRFEEPEKGGNMNVGVNMEAVRQTLLNLLHR